MEEQNQFKPRPFLIVEGARCAGKTYLTNTLKDQYQLYKLPFEHWFKNGFTKNVPDEMKMNFNSKKEVFYFTVGFDVVVLDMYKFGLARPGMILDRHLFSHAVFGVQSGRITEYEAKIHLDYIYENYGDLFYTVHINSSVTEDTRNKDSWDIYKIEETNKLYEEFYKHVDYKNIITFNNYFDEASVDVFKTLANSLVTPVRSFESLEFEPKTISEITTTTIKYE